MTRRGRAAWLALGMAVSCALPELRVDPDLDESAGQSGDDDAGSTSSGGGGKGGAATGGRGGGSGTSQGGSDTGGSDTGGADTGGSDSGGTSTGGKGGSATGGKGGSATGGKGGSATGGVAGSATGGRGGAGGAAGTPSGGMGGDPCGSRVAVPGDASIDDLEQGNATIKPPRIGYWFSYNDGACVPQQVPAPDGTGTIPFAPAAGAGHGAYAARTTGGPCGTWGAGIGFSLASCSTMDAAYDASVFNGLTFWYKSTSEIVVYVSTIPVIPTTRGGTCVPGAGAGMECDNSHGARLPGAPAGTTVTIPFSTLTQEYGQLRPFDKSQMVGITWQVTSGIAFDFTIDDIAFTP